MVSLLRPIVPIKFGETVRMYIKNKALRKGYRRFTKAPWAGGAPRGTLRCVLVMISAVFIGPSAQALAPENSPPGPDNTLTAVKSEVWDIYGEYAVRGFKVNQSSLQAMIATGLKRVTGRADPNQAWHSLLAEDDVIALKFNRIASRGLGTNRAVACALLSSLYRAGFSAENIMLVGLDELPDEAAGTRPCPYGWQDQDVDFFCDRDYLPRWLDEVTAIINVPSIMDDNIVALRCCLVNLSLPLLKQPARLYINAGDPFIADIYNLDQIRDKVRLHIANGLRILYYGGPEIKQVFVYEHGSLLFSTDPVALDQIALQLILRARRTMTLPVKVDSKLTCDYLKTAEACGLGNNDLNNVDYHFIKHENW